LTLQLSSEPTVQEIRMVGRYRLGHVLGRGGMSIVYAAEHATLGRRFALKFLRHELATNSRRVRRFEREARLLSRLEHENIVGLLDIGIDPTLGPYLVLENIPGCTLREELCKGRASVCRILEITRQIECALSFAHAAGIVHRDLKPENVMLSRHADGRLLVKLLDFGVAKLREELDEQLTGTDAAIGTAAYMSPEQACGSTRLDARADVYALGVVIYEALSGTRPHEGASYNATIFQILHAPHRPLAELRPDLPLQLTEAVERALTKDPAGRPSSVAEFAEQLGLSPPPSAAPITGPVASCETTLDESVTRTDTRAHDKGASTRNKGIWSFALGGAAAAAMAVLLIRLAIANERAEEHVSPTPPTQNASPKPTVEVSREAEPPPESRADAQVVSGPGERIRDREQRSVVRLERDDRPRSDSSESAQAVPSAAAPAVRQPVALRQRGYIIESPYAAPAGNVAPTGSGLRAGNQP
jgi:serine/threonine protein kinase